MHDVLVVGGSIAGAATAIHLAEAGRRVLLVERSRGVRRKACGEGLFPRGVAELGRLGLIEDVRRHGAPLAGVRFHAGRFTAQAPFGPDEPPGLGVQRTDLDPRLLDRARAAGVEVRTGVTARSLIADGARVAGVRTDGGELRARAIIAADGLGSRLRRQAGLDRSRNASRYGISAHVRLPRDPGCLVDVYFHGAYESYVTPVGEDIVNVAMLVRRADMRRFAGNLGQAFVAMLEEHPALSDGFELLDEPVAAGPFAAACRRAWRGNLVLVGDAAGFVDAINGEGMSSALVSARDCATAVDAYLATGDDSAFRRYEAQRRALVRNSNLLARLSLAIGARPVLARLAVRNLARRPRTFARLTAVSTGELPLRAVRPSDLLALAAGV